MGNTLSEELEPQDSWWNPMQTQVQSLPSSSTSLRNEENDRNNIETQTDDTESSQEKTQQFTEKHEQNARLPDTDSDEDTGTKIVEEITEKLIKRLENTNVSSEKQIGCAQICDTKPSSSEETEVDYKKINQEKMEQFRSELAKKHLARRQAIAERSKEILFLREELAKQKKDNEDLREQLNKKEPVIDTSWKEDCGRLKEENDMLNNKLLNQEEELKNHQEILQNNHELRISLSEVQSELQNANSQVISFEKERHDYETHVSAMKEVVKVSKQLLEIREHQLEDLRAKVAEIESNLAKQENTMLATNLRNEYEKQLRNMRALRTLYEQRQAATKAERDSIAKELDETQKKLEMEQNKTKELEERVEELEKTVSEKYDKVYSLESQLGLVQAECRGLQREMSVINQLFSQILIGFSNGQVDMDKLIKLLEENHDLLTDIVINEESVEHISALPKTLLDLIDQVQCKEETDESVPSTSDAENTEQTEQVTGQVISAAEIVQNLPKVWRVLAELLSQQSGQQPVVINDDGTDPCYKSIETPKGPKLVLSVSQTFIRLKDLILEKKSLEKEMTRLKQLNTHLEVRLQDQEKRLETVSTELSKTWHVVGRMQRQHQQLHTHEKILRYELAQKRKMLTELKQELEYCREKWVQAREKNSNTEEEWKKLRTEFAARKITVTDDLNNSGESGYSDERECSSDDDSYNPKNKAKSESDIEDTPEKSDTEDNQEISESDDDILESAFNKACTQVLPKPNLTLSQVVDLNDLTGTENCDNQTDSSTNQVLHSSTKTEATENDNNEEVLNLESSQNETVTSQSTESKKCIDTEFIQSTSRQSNEESSQNETVSSQSTESKICIDTEFIQSTSRQSISEESSQNETVTSQRIENEKCTEADLTQSNSSQSISTESSQTERETSINLESSTDASQNNSHNSPESSQPSTSQETRTSEEILAKREERLRRLEEQCKQLVKKVTNTTNRGAQISSRLTTLHEQYGTQNNENTETQRDTQSEENTQRDENT